MLTEETNIITATAQRNSLVSGPSDPVTAYYDASPPTSTITAPANDGDWVGGTYTFAGQTTDPSGLTDVSYRIDGGPTWISLGPAQNWSVVTDTTLLTEGVAHTFSVRGTDTWNKVENPPAERIFNVDNTPPTAWMLSLPAYETSADFDVHWSGDDTPSDIDHFDAQYQVDDPGPPWQDWITNTLDTSRNFNGANNTTYYFRVQATDLAGNLSGWSEPVSITVDSDAPEIISFSASPRAFSPNGDEVQDQTIISASMSDFSPIDWEVVVREDTNGPIVDGVSGQGETINWPWDGNGQPDNDYTLYLTAEDGAFQPRNDTLTVILDTTPPVVDNIYQPDTLSPWVESDVYYTTQSSVLIRGTREDENEASGQSGVIAVEVELNDGPPMPANLVGDIDGSGTPGFSLTVGGLTPNAMNTLTITHTDEAGNEATATRQVYVDTDQPSVTNFSPTGTINDNTPTLSGDFDSPGGSPIDPSSVTITLDGAPVNGGTVDANGFSIPLSTPLADDGHQVEVSLANQAGTSGQTSWVFALDANTWLTDLSPADGAILNRDSITVSGRAEVGNVVTLTVDSSFVATTTVSATNDFTLTEVAVTDGPHTLTALTADDLGNPAQASSEITVCAVQRNFRIESGVLGVFTGLQLRKIQCNFRKSPLFQRNFRKNPSLIILCIS